MEPRPEDNVRAAETARINRKAWSQSHSNQMLFTRDLKPEQVRWEDIPHALAQKCRFSGQADMPGGIVYSVAQHCVVGARMMPRAFALPFLLHEVSEVYLPDVPAPLKPFVWVTMPNGEPMMWKDLEALHADVILEALGLSSLRPLIDSPEVKKMDLAMLAAEKRDLLGPEPESWGLTVDAVATVISPLRPQVAAAAFSELFFELTNL